ncbi:hypothetical protein [Deinococcus aquiradiocola]|uniref:Uncharacterized protein n=1 Tax=Deinococcus aquiradiocola TaxID=393059 RepID=A0A917PJG6_9DEIO|nr:hypothetical protein [Deinococcus aquiradiocola]GGJ81841.1 hypothetical protein GCM10008939_27250 [Deinococcus aquiradiocola]
MSEDKAGNLLDAAKAKINEGADRLRAAGHEVASHVGNNPAENAADKAKALEDRAKAEAHNAEADHHANEAKKD